MVEPEEIIKIAYAHAKKVCWHHPEWDWEDLAGCIIEACVRWPPHHPAEVTMRSKWATADWFQRRMGKEGQRADIEAAAPFSMFEAPSGDDMDMGYDQAALADEFGEVYDRDIIAWVHSLLPPREQQTLTLVLDGHSIDSAAKLMGTSKASAWRSVDKIKHVLGVASL